MLGPVVEPARLTILNVKLWLSFLVAQSMKFMRQNMAVEASDNELRAGQPAREEIVRRWWWQTLYFKLWPWQLAWWSNIDHMLSLKK